MKNTIVEKGQKKLMTPRQRYWMNIWKHREFYLFCVPLIVTLPVEETAATFALDDLYVSFVFAFAFRLNAALP